MKRLVVLITTLLCLGAPVSVYAAYNPLANACGSSGGASASSACSADPTKDPLAGPNGIIKKVSLLLAVLGGIAAVILIIVSGFRYVIANGDAQKAASARNGIVGAVVGLAIIAAAEAIVIFVVSKL